VNFEGIQVDIDKGMCQMLLWTTGKSENYENGEGEERDVFKETGNGRCVMLHKEKLRVSLCSCSNSQIEEDVLGRAFSLDEGNKN